MLRFAQHDMLLVFLVNVHHCVPTGYLAPACRVCTPASGCSGRVRPLKGQRPSRTCVSYSSRNNLMLLVIELVAASPNGQKDLPLMLSQTSSSRSMSFSLPCPSSMR